MKKFFFLFLMIFLTGCGGEVGEREQATTGMVGVDEPVSRKMAAKTIGMAFYTNEELGKLEKEVDFSDVSDEDWAYPYICGCVEKGFFTGGEEGEFRPDDPMTLWEAQVLMDRLAPDYDSRIILTEENKNKAVSYELWLQLLETALKARRGEDSLYSYGFRRGNAVLLSAEGIFDTGTFTAAGIDLQPYLFSRITFWEKDGEIVALLTMEAASPILQNVYCRKEKGKLVIETGADEAIFAYKGKIKEGICDVKLENGKVAEVTPASSLGRCTVKRVNDKEILLMEKGVMKWGENVRIYGTDGENVEKTDIICGTDGAEFFGKDEERGKYSISTGQIHRYS